MKKFLLLVVIVNLVLAILPNVAFADDMPDADADFILFLKYLARKIFIIIIYFAILVCGPYCLVKGFYLMYKKESVQEQGNPLIYIVVGISLLCLPILIAVFIKTLQSTGPFGEDLANLLLYIIP